MTTDDAAPVQYEEKGKAFRQYEADPKTKVQQRVKDFYHNQHRNQTVEFVEQMKRKWLQFDHAELGVLDCLDLLANFLDQSDPDVDEANRTHAYQTAERLREQHPDKPWMHLAGLVHDLGKVMSVWGEEQWAVTGDTFPVGCAPDPSIVYGVDSFKGNKDLDDPRYKFALPSPRILCSTKLGMYKEGCGFEQLSMCWSHDEYIYQVLKHHGTTLPDDALYAMRFHSFYPAHSEGGYKQFESQRDRDLHAAIMMLNSCDLYSKADEQPDIEALKPYYQSLIDKYIPGTIKW